MRRQESSSGSKEVSTRTGKGIQGVASQKGEEVAGPRSEPEEEEK